MADYDPGVGGSICDSGVVHLTAPIYATAHKATHRGSEFTIL